MYEISSCMKTFLGSMYEFSSCMKTFFGSMYEISSGYDRGFLIDEIMLYLIMYELFHDPYWKSTILPLTKQCFPLLGLEFFSWTRQILLTCIQINLKWKETRLNFHSNRGFSSLKQKSRSQNMSLVTRFIIVLPTQPTTPLTIAEQGK